MTGELDDQLLPDQTRFSWWAVAVVGVVLQIAIGLPMWYAVYVAGYSRDQLGSTIASSVMSVPGGEVVAVLVIMGLLAGIVGPALGLWQHHTELERRGAELGLRWRLVTVLCIQLWPLSVITAAKHWRVRQQCD
jgi:hypothetical protein